MTLDAVTVTLLLAYDQPTPVVAWLGTFVRTALACMPEFVASGRPHLEGAGAQPREAGPNEVFLKLEVVPFLVVALPMAKLHTIATTNANVAIAAVRRLSVIASLSVSNLIEKKVPTHPSLVRHIWRTFRADSSAPPVHGNGRRATPGIGIAQASRTGSSRTAPSTGLSIVSPL